MTPKLKLFFLIMVGGGASTFWIHTQLFKTGEMDLPSYRSIYDREGRLLRGGLNSTQQLFIPIKNLEGENLFQKAIISIEDHRFFYHFGLDPLALFRAFFQLLKEGEVVSGASTIPMQTARLLDPAPRTLKNKIKEMIRALQLEWNFSKQEILTKYFSLLPFGGNISGLQTASWVYFKKQPSQLTPGQAALLAAIPKNPNGLDPRKFLEKCLERQKIILNKMRDFQFISSAQWKEGSSEVFTQHSIHSNPLPMIAPHATDFILSLGKKGELNSTLYEPDQSRIQNLVHQIMPKLKAQNIQDISIVVKENGTGAIRAYLGSGDYFDPKGGQNQGGFSPRSPGSTLKPFLYLMGLERGEMTPDLVLEDIPTHYKSMDPENFDRTFKGLIQAKEALRLSLNIPAIRLLAKCGLVDFHDFLQRFGFKFLTQTPQFYGLGLVLGGCEVNLIQLVDAFSILARRGTLIPSQWIIEKKSLEAIPVVSEESTLLLKSMLPKSGKDGKKGSFFYKTGTSSNQRDAWCIGFDSQCTIGVWTGNFTGESSPSLVGKKVALPILEKIFSFISLDPGDNLVPDPTPPKFSLQPYPYCPLSGLEKGEGCPTNEWGKRIRGVYNLGPCKIHTSTLVNLETEREHCTNCQGDLKLIKRDIVDFLNPEIAPFLAKMGHFYPSRPPHFEGCSLKRKQEVKLLEPAPGDHYLKLPDEPCRIKIRIAAGSEFRNIFLYLNENFYSTISPPFETWIEAQEGNHHLRVVGEDGGESWAHFTVEGT